MISDENDDQGSSGYGDPHFHILAQSESQPDLCFEFDGEPESDMLLIQNPMTGFTVTGTLFKPVTEENGIYFRHLKIVSPHETEMFVSAKFWNIHSNLRFNPLYTWASNTLNYADFVLGSVQESSNGKTMHVTVVGGPTFQVATGDKHGNVNFKLLNHGPIVEETTGIIGQFLPPGAYKIHRDEDSSNQGTLEFRGESVNVTYQLRGRNKDCWTIKTNDAKKLIENGQTKLH